jgi:hypothetical protein
MYGQEDMETLIGAIVQLSVANASKTQNHTLLLFFPPYTGTFYRINAEAKWSLKFRM